MTYHRSRMVAVSVAACAALLMGCPVAAAETGVTTPERGPWSVDVGDTISLSLRPVENEERSEVVELQRLQVFADDAEVVLHTANGDVRHPVPDNRYFKGRLDGRPASLVLVTILESGEVRGLISERGRYWMIGRDAAAKDSLAPIEFRPVNSVAELDHKAHGYDCAADSLPPPPADPRRAVAGIKRAPFAPSTVTYTARIAVETDNEFFNKFGNPTDATNYVADVIAYSSTIYSEEANTSWILQHLSLWPPAQTDPWAQQSPSCGLYEFGRYWNDHRTGVLRTTTAFFSGKSSNSGIAWVGVLCRGQFNVDLTNAGCSLSPTTDNYGGAYAYIGGMDANFDIDNPSVVWDILAVTHEIGHNFNSGHTHCYEGLGGNSSAIDPCYSGQCGRSGCFCGTTGYPSGCPGAGSGCGTIMSYCHLRSGGMGNITMTLGQGHPYGIAPERVPDRMEAHVQSQASYYPGCLDYTVADLVFTDGFESGDETEWDGTTE